MESGYTLKYRCTRSIYVLVTGLFGRMPCVEHISERGTLSLYLHMNIVSRKNPTNYERNGR